MNVKYQYKNDISFLSTCKLSNGMMFYTARWEIIWVNETVPSKYSKFLTQVRITIYKQTLNLSFNILRLLVINIAKTVFIILSKLSKTTYSTINLLVDN